MMHPSELGEVRDRDLLKRIASGDEEAFRRLFRRYAPVALALAGRVLRQRFLAEETVQESFLSVWKNPGAYDPDRGSVRAWLMSTVHHRSVDMVRREEAQRRRAEASAPDPSDARPDPAEEVIEEIGLPQERAAVRGALETLPPDQRQVIELMYFGGLSQSRIAQGLSIPLGTVKSRTLLGMRRLRNALSGMDR